MIVATVERLRPSDRPMFVAVSPFLYRFIMSHFISMAIAFRFFDALPSDEPYLRFGAMMKGEMFTQP